MSLDSRSSALQHFKILFLKGRDFYSILKNKDLEKGDTLGNVLGNG